MRSTLLVFTVVLLASGESWAEEKKKLFTIPASFCPSAVTIASQIEDCDENDQFITQGDQCLTKLEQEIASASSKMNANFSKDLDRKQKEKFTSSLVDYSLSSETTAYLIAVTKLAISEVSAYPAAIAKPEDFGEEFLNQGDPEKFSLEAECYGETKKSLSGLMSDFNFLLNKLEAVKKITDANAAKSAQRKSGVDTSSNQEILTGGKTDKLPAVEQGKNGKDKSDITGVKEDKFKRQKKSQ